MTLLTAFAVSVAALTVAYLFFGEYTRKAHISGVLVPDLGLIRLVPQQAATVLEIHAREGQAVRQGDLLFVLSVHRATPIGDTHAAVQQRTDAEERNRATRAPEAVEIGARPRVTIRAPQDGVLTAVLAEPGQNVSPAAALASLVPAQAQLQAQLVAPAGAIGFLRPQQAVLLRYQAFPYQKFGHHSGQVLQVSRTPLQASDLAGLSLSTPATGAGAGAFGGRPNASEPLYRITVALDRQAVSAYGQALPLSAGMQLEADVLLDRRRLIEWLFEPLLGLAGRV